MHNIPESATFTPRVREQENRTLLVRKKRKVANRCLTTTNMLAGPQQGLNPPSGRKKQNRMSIDREHVLKVGLEIMHRKGHGGSTITAERRFRELFGCAPDIAVAVWKLIDRESALPGKAAIDHLLWALMFLKVYSKEATASGMAGGVDEKTYRKWVWLFVVAISELEGSVVSAEQSMFGYQCL